MKYISSPLSSDPFFAGVNVLIAEENNAKTLKTNGMKQVQVARFGSIFCHNRSRWLWEASGMRPGATNVGKVIQVTALPVF